jgi:hypothetical protein
MLCYSMSDEVIVSVITDATGQKGYWGLNRDFDLLFTNERIICALTANTGGAAMLGGWIGYAISKSGKGKARAKYQTMTIEEIMSSNNKNFAIPYGSVKEVRINQILGNAGVGIKWSGGTTGFNFPKAQIDVVKRMVNTYLNGKLKSGWW